MEPLATINGEAMMDLKLTGSVAPGATLVVYGQNAHYGYSSNRWIDSLVAALDQPDYRCQVMSMSLGAPESSYSPQTALAVDLLFAVASLCGVTVCVSSGDYGAPGRKTGPERGTYEQNCAFPASSSFALACGGTELVLDPPAEPGEPAVLKGEVVWNEMTAPDQKRATGGGISMLFPVPEYQQALTLPSPINPGQGPGRGVPDVASNVAHVSGYALGPEHKGGAFGTSAAAPIWAALIALLIEGNGAPIGFLNPILYRLQLSDGTCCTPIVEGDNGPPGQEPDSKISFSAGAPWNACCGLGSPLGGNIAKALGISNRVR
jgi:kumamolisin